MKGQASAEYLLLFMVSLSLLGISAASLGAIRDSALHGITMHDFKRAALALSDVADEVCALGDGNSRMMHLGMPITIEEEPGGDGPLLRFSFENSSLVQGSLCEAGSASLEAGEIYVENKGGKISFTAR
jgi:hypothetical protein